MSVGSIGPSRRREGDEIMGEIDKDVHEVPVPNGIRVGVRPALNPPVVVRIPALEVVADEDPTARRRLHRRRGKGD